MKTLKFEGQTNTTYMRPMLGLVVPGELYDVEDDDAQSLLDEGGWVEATEEEIAARDAALAEAEAEAADEQPVPSPDETVEATKKKGKKPATDAPVGETGAEQTTAEEGG